jgi:hypothetical protein
METETKKDIYLLQNCEKKEHIFMESTLSVSLHSCALAVLSYPTVLLYTLFELFTLSTGRCMKAKNVIIADMLYHCQNAVEL